MKIDMKAYAERHPHLARQAGLTGKERASVPTANAGAAAEQALSQSLTLLGIPHETQYHWHPERKWHSDAAIPEAKLLVEVDGRAHIAGYERFCADMVRRRAATFEGWYLLAFSPAEAESGTAALEVQRWLAGRNA